MVDERENFYPTNIRGGHATFHFQSNQSEEMRKRLQEQEKENKKKNMFEEAMTELEALDGMGMVQEKIKEALALANIYKARNSFNLKNEQHALHMIFTGNAGTGKTTVARIVGKLFVGAGLLKKGNFTETSNEIRHNNNNNNSQKDKDVPFVECTNADISSAFWGEDEKNMKKKFDEANGGVLFIDEAYSMISRSGHRSGEKVSAVMVSEMENRRESVCVIGAGYPTEMEEFIQYNTGLASRFATVINFPNYSVPQLLKIAESMTLERDYTMSLEYKSALARRLEKERLLYTFGNARTVRNILEESMRKQAKRIYEKYGSTPSRESLMLLKIEDLEEYNPVFSGKEIKDSYKELYAQALASGMISGGKSKKVRIKKQY